ncbi:IS3 family transposase [Streptomyces sp. NPDC014983]|uniref:IS3 family transposase n=1 Tax=Streptomyces sp. NPDC014983 TaxID=3364933 RepID=UPI0036FDA0DB
MALTLDAYRLLGRSGLRVSPLALGTATFGTEWGWGAERAEARKLFDHYVGLGGNVLVRGRGRPSCQAGRRRRARARDHCGAHRFPAHLRCPARADVYSLPRSLWITQPGSSHAELRRLGRRVNRKRVARVMRERDIRGVTRRRRRSLTGPDAKAEPAPDLIGRDFHAERPGTRLVGDITYLPTAEGWLYLACWLDLATRVPAPNRQVGTAAELRTHRTMLRQRRRGKLLGRPIVDRLEQRSVTGSGGSRCVEWSASRQSGWPSTGSPEPGLNVVPRSYCAIPKGRKSASARTRQRNSEVDMPYRCHPPTSLDRARTG